MLPAFPKIVTKRDHLNAETIQFLVNQKEPMLGGISGHIVHEGATTALARSTGEVDETEMQAHEASVEFGRMKVSEFIAKHSSFLEEAAEQFAQSRSKQVLSVMHEATEKTGNVVDGKGRPFSEDLLFELLEKMAHSFDENGEWQPPSLVVGHALHAKIIEHDRTRTDAQRKAAERKLNALIERKKAEYDTEQAGRVLAG